MNLTTNIFERVVRLSFDNGSTATGTVIEQAGGVYVTTAAHVLPADPNEEFLINNRLGAQRAAFPRVQGINPHADVIPQEYPSLPCLCFQCREYTIQGAGGP